jgi:hypothetical protein
MSKVYNPKTRRMVLRSGKTGKTIVKTISNDKPLSELPDDVIRIILNLPTVATSVCKVTKELHLQHEKRMIIAIRCFEWIYNYMVATSYFTKETFTIISKSNIIIQILVNSYPNKNLTTKYQFKLNNNLVFKFEKKLEDIRKDGIKLREILPQYLSEILNDALLSIISIDLDISQQVEIKEALYSFRLSPNYSITTILNYNMKRISESKKLQMEI